MPNWCSNNVTFIGDEKKIKNLMKAFEKSIKHTEEGNGVRFILIPPDHTVQNWFFDLCINNEESISYETKWSPDPVHLVQAAKMFDVGFELDYSEGTSVYGEFKYNPNEDVLYDRCLDSTDELSVMICSEESCESETCDGGDDCEDSIFSYDIADEILSSKEYRPCPVNLKSGTYE